MYRWIPSSLLYFLILSLIKFRAAKGNSRIVGGQTADSSRYPYFVEVVFYIDQNSGYACGGTLIHSDLVLTAAHCYHAEDSVVGAVNGEARVGAYKYIDDGSDGSIVRKIAQVLRHPQFNEKTQENDVMLLLLDAPVLDTQLVELNSDPNFPISGQEVQAIGLGALQEPMNQIDDRYPKYLQEVTVQVVSNTDCQRQYQLVAQDVVRSEMHLCAAASGKDTCQGDSGGPLLVTQDNGFDVQVGMSSFGIGCANPLFSGVYIRVSNYFYWIQTSACSMSNNPPSQCPSQMPSASPSTTAAPTRTFQPSSTPSLSTVPSISSMPTTESFSASSQINVALSFLLAALIMTLYI